MKVDDFWDMTPRLLQLKMKGKRESELMEMRISWEQVRFQTVCLINKDRKQNQQIKQTQLIEFEWEKNKNKKAAKSEINKVKYLVEKERKRMEKIKTKGGGKSEIITGVN